MSNWRCSVHGIGVETLRLIQVVRIEKSVIEVVVTTYAVTLGEQTAL